MANFAPPTNGNMATETTGTPINGTGLDSSFPPSNALPQGAESSKTLWMGELEPWMDENFVKNVFTTVSGENVNVKVIRDRASGNAGYCFVEFNTIEAATKALGLNGTAVPNSTRVFKLNWASGGGLMDRRDDRSPEFSIFVGDLGPEVNEFVLVSLFQARFPSCKSAKIMTDAVTGQSRGYGFVRFSDETDQQRALVEMQGVYCGNRPMRISTATPKTRSHQYGQGQHGGHMPPHGGPAQGGMGWAMNNGGNGGYYQPGFAPMAPQPMNQFTDPNNTTVFVGGLSGYVTEDELRSFFQGFGEITYVKIPPGKGCGFVQFVHRHAAEMAINQMQGYPIGNSRVRLSWGRSQNNSGVGTPYRPAPPPPHYPVHGAVPGGVSPYGPGPFGGGAHQGPPGPPTGV
ncbi:mRNA-binding post-transcriptional regulator [Niveomyces insectorum RCEF 264]|uniref:mRNA-binding post-transcriptional regulator n=1 Tax=Niveomyces insectorum RCEF 264 TaxID=1081102 RepID=A0A167M4T6_9HYPO|nr:mRNA-binding post-transcriptional regulator [Niveomyces insectorum RCEF 264]